MAGSAQAAHYQGSAPADLLSHVAALWAVGALLLRQPLRRLACHEVLRASCHTRGLRKLGTTLKLTSTENTRLRKVGVLALVTVACQVQGPARVDLGHIHIINLKLSLIHI